MATRFLVLATMALLSPSPGTATSPTAPAQPERVTQRSADLIGSAPGALPRQPGATHRTAPWAATAADIDTHQLAHDIHKLMHHTDNADPPPEHDIERIKNALDSRPTAPIWANHSHAERTAHAPCLVRGPAPALLSWGAALFAGEGRAPAGTE